MDDAVLKNRIIENIFESIGFKINEQKCGLLLNTNQPIHRSLERIPVVSESTPYKYLGIEVDSKVNIPKYISRVIKEIEGKLDEILIQNTSSINAIRRINSEVITKLKYGFSVVPWRIGELETCDKLIRKKLMDYGYYSKMLPSSRLYIPLEKMGLGLESVRMECGKEILRVYLRFITNQTHSVGKMLILSENRPEGLWRRLAKCFNKRLYINELKGLITIPERKKSLKEILAWVDNEILNKNLAVWISKKGSSMRRILVNGDCETKVAAKMWKRLNISKQSYLQVLKIQEHAVVTGNRKSMITHNDADKCCKCDKSSVASIEHLLLNCPFFRKMQIRRHDIICEFVWKAIRNKYFKQTQNIEIQYIPKCIKNDEITLLYNKQITTTNDTRFGNRHDIYLEFPEPQKAFIIDATIVKDENIKQAFINKINKYKELQKHIIETRGYRFIEIIPIVMTISGIINEVSVTKLNNLKLSIDFVHLTRKVLITNMQDLMFALSNTNCYNKEEPLSICNSDENL